MRQEIFSLGKVPPQNVEALRPERVVFFRNLFMHPYALMPTTPEPRA